MLEQFVKRIAEVTRRAKSEASLQIKLEAILAELLSLYGIGYQPSVNETLSSQGLSQVDSTRPDSLFGHVVLDYKAPGLLKSAKELSKAKRQITGYLDNVTAKDHVTEAQKWAGILWDGASITFCHSDGQGWQWSGPFSVSEASLLRLIGNYRALKRKPLTARLLAQSFGKESDVARAAITTMCDHLSKPQHRTTMLYREWKRLFEQVSTFGLDQLPALKAWATSLGIATTDASQILFAIHSYYALVVKLLIKPVISRASYIRIGASRCTKESGHDVG